MNNREAREIIAHERDNDVFVSEYRNKVHEAQNLAIKALEQSEWIPVRSGKMPTSYVAVEVTVIRKDKTWNQTPYIRLAEWHEGLKDWFEIPYPIDQPFGERLSESDGGDATVIAWRPMPEPYKEE